MRFLILFILLALVLCEGTEPLPGTTSEPAIAVDNDRLLANTVLLAAFVVFRHGDRTPDQDELDKFPSKEHYNDEIYFPYGKKALTNKGKQRAYLVGQYLRHRYNNTILSPMYLPDETYIQTTNYARTQMTVLTALAALFEPTPAQKWNPNLNWQPVPYDTPAYEDDDFLYYYQCQRYLRLREKVYVSPEFEEQMKPYEGLYKYLNKMFPASNITTSEDVFYLDNLVQALENVGVPPPQWIVDYMPQIKEITKIEYAAEFYNSEMIALSAGVLMDRILNAATGIINGEELPKLWLFSGHENNVGAFMSAIRVFYVHQPQYGSTVSLELRKDLVTGRNSFLVVYAPEAGGPDMILPIRGCGGQALCDYETFVSLTREHRLSMTEYIRQCSIPIH
ncbi:unnamed protein product [Leptidea sinapis]|uniref:acid phosphatase n=1 Tax=Leptidea sinapis TaxID=189913 RepID=A0A5E4PWF7_9NEOP|nr:unnamed protein product [Leptidea sinapis]